MASDHLIMIYKRDFKATLERNDKPSSVRLALGWLEDGSLSVPELYEKVLAPTLNVITCPTTSGKWCVWLEHIRTAIVRTIIENSYPHALKERDRILITGSGDKFHAIPRKVIVACPSGENHELGARMAADFFTIAGFDAVYLGCDMPREDLVDAVRLTRPGYLALSVSNPFNLVEARRVIGAIRSLDMDGKPRILVGGHSFAVNSQAVRDLGADALVGSFDDIMNLGRGGEGI